MFKTNLKQNLQNKTRHYDSTNIKFKNKAKLNYII